MTDNKAQVKDHAKETEKPKDKGPDHLVHQNTGADALKVIKKHDEAKKADGLGHVEIVDKKADKPADKPGDKPGEKPQDKKPVDVEKMKKQADEIYDATEGKWFGKDKEKVKNILKDLNEDERKVLRDQYQQKHGKPLDQMLREQMSGKDLTESLTHLNARDSQKGADRGRADRIAEAIDNAANGGVLGIGTDKKAIEEQLKGKTPEELRDIDVAYRARTGIGLRDELKDELSGSDLARAMDLADGHNDDAARIHTGLIERKEWGFGTRSNGNIDKDMRDTISTMNSQQLADLDRTYQQRYGTTAREALLNNPDISADTKKALEIYFKGTDKRTPDDTLALADTALKSKNMEIFQEAFASASPEARAKFMQNDGEARVNRAFGSNYIDDMGQMHSDSNDETRRAMDYVKQGKLDTATKIADNTGFFGDNEEAIQQSIAQMSDRERQQYINGRRLTESASNGTPTEAEKADLEVYNRIHGALAKAGNEREMAKWQDQIANGKDGSLVSRIADHGGMMRDGIDSYLKTIETMPKQDWERLKSDPEYRKQVEGSLALDLNGQERQRALDVLDRKIASGTFEQSQTQQRSVLDSINDKTGFFSNDKEGILGSLQGMTPAEQERYRKDPEFKAQLDKSIQDNMGSGAERDAAMGILDRVAKGQKPEQDIVSKLEMHSTHWNTDEGKVVADLEEAFRKDPGLRDRINNPKTDADREMSQRFDSALCRSLDPDEYDKYAKPLLETGRIPFNTKAELYKGVFNDDEAGVYDALKKGRGTPEDYRELLADPEKALPFMSKEEREVAVNIARQNGEMKPEDELRAAMLGAGTDEAKIKEILGGLPPEKAKEIKDAYEVKYGSNLLGDTMDELGGSDKKEVARDLRGPQTAREAYNESRSEVYESADGVGRWVVKNLWDGTADMTQDQMQQYSSAMGNYSQRFQEMPDGDRAKFAENLQKSLELYQKSESAAADMAVDGAIIAAGVGGAAFTGGVSLGLLGATTVGGALFKVGAKSAIMGSDYDFASAQVLTDGATGAIDAATIFLGPAQAAQMLRLGEKSAVTAARTIISEADNVAVAGGRQLLKEGAQATIEKEMKEQVALAIANGAHGVTDKSIGQIAAKVATSPEDIPAVQRLIAENLKKAVEVEAKAGLKAQMKEVALNTGAGALGGGLSGGVRGGVEGESLEAALTQGAMGALAGGTMAGVMTVGMKGIGRSIEAVRGGHADVPGGALPEVRPLPESRPPLELRSFDEFGLKPKSNTDELGRITEINSGEGRLKLSYDNPADPKMITQVEFPNGNISRTKDGVNWRTEDHTAPGGYYDSRSTFRIDKDNGLEIINESNRSIHVYENMARDGSIDGRDVSHLHAVQDKFRYMDTELQASSVRNVSRELQDVRAVDAYGRETSAFNSLAGDPRLTVQQKQNILENLAVVREHFASYRDGARMHADPEVNWIHTQGEMAKVLEVSRKSGLSAQETEDAILASMYSDSVKFAFPAPKGAQPNFFTHHLDGALAAHDALSKKGFPPERIERIVQAIKEHQIAPPEFMGQLYNFRVKQGLSERLANGSLTAERHAQLQKVLDDMTVTGPDNIARIKPLAEVNTWPKVKNADGSYELALTKDQRELLGYAGVERWNTPVNPADDPAFKTLAQAEQDRLTSQYKISTALINGDGIDNYATLGGASKIVTIRGPETMFQDGNIWKSIGSIDTSFKDAYSVMTPEGRMLADQSLAQRNALLHDPESGVMTQMNKWLETKGLKPEDVVYLRPDGQLKYPTKDVPLTGEDLKQYELAKEVRAKMADLMRAGHRTDGSLPGNFEPSISNRVDPGRNVAKPVEMPAATGKSITDASGASITPTEHGHIKRSADGKMQIRNDAEDYTRTYDANGRIVESVQSGRKQEYFYDTNGNLKDIRFGDGSVANRDPNGDWTHRSIGANKQIVEQPFHRGTVIADSDGTIRMLEGTGMLKYENMTVFNTRGETIHYVNGRARYDVSLAKESRDLNRLATESFTEPQQLARFNKFREEFEAAAVTRGITPEQTAQFYKQINRLLDKNPNAVLSQSERTQLAEQLMAHSARPDTVDQGAFSTCNVTTLEVRNYSRNPAANAQLVADIATTGKFMTNNGIEIDMTQVAGGIKPDHHALASLKRQAEGLDVVKKDGGRDWASQITETAMVNAHWQANPHMVVNGRLTGAWDLAYDKSGLVIGRFNDRMAKLPKLYDKDGKELTHYTDGMKLFDKKGRELTDFDPNNIVYDNGRNLRGMVDTDKILTFTDAAGKRLKAREVGANGFDVNGEPVYRHVPAGSGELKYQNSGTRTAREQVMFNDGARWRQLLDESGDKMDAPGIPTDKLSRANTQATDTPDQSYVIQAAESTYRYSNVSQVSSADELGKTLEEMIRLKQMPAVLQVHTGNTPFSSGLGIDQAFGIGGWHVVNIHDYDPVTRTVKFTNQWGSGSDRMGPQGYSLDKFYKSMNESKLHKFMSSTPGRYLQGTAAAVAAGGYGYFLLKDR